MNDRSHTERKIKELKTQLAGETRARMAAEQQARDAEARAVRAEFRERECDAEIRKLRMRLELLEAKLKSLGVQI